MRLFILLIGLTMSLCGADRFSPQGSLTLEDGHTVQCQRIHNLLPANPFRLRINGQIQTIRPQEISRIDIVRASIGAQGDYHFTANLTLTNGQDTVVTEFPLGDAQGMVTGEYPSAATGQLVTQRFPLKGGPQLRGVAQVVALQFTPQRAGRAGQLVKIAPSTGRVFPASFNYDPYSGERLTLQEDGQTGHPPRPHRPVQQPHQPAQPPRVPVPPHIAQLPRAERIQAAALAVAMIQTNGGSRKQLIEAQAVLETVINEP